MATSRDPKELREVWEGWHTISPPMRQDYARFVELANKGAKELGFADTGAMWRLKYDMPADDVHEGTRSAVGAGAAALHLAARLRADEAAREVRRRRAGERAHSRRICWATSGRRTGRTSTPLVAAPAAPIAGYSLTDILKRAEDHAGGRWCASASASTRRSASRRCRETFWERSLFTKPRDRDVVCHASAWDIDSVDDLRIKMCIDPTEEDFTTIHHELGHNYYSARVQGAAGDLPGQRERRIPRGDRRHDRAVGDAGIPGEDRPARSRRPTPRVTSACCMARALEKMAFLPFGLLIDQWRWQVFSGQVARPTTTKPGGSCGSSTRASRRRRRAARTSSIPARSITCPANTPYTRYFLATSCSSSSTASCRRLPAARRRSIAARSTTARPPAGGWTRC